MLSYYVGTKQTAKQHGDNTHESVELINRTLNTDYKLTGSRVMKIMVHQYVVV